jgi:hypothetical protein
LAGLTPRSRLNTRAGPGVGETTVNPTSLRGDAGRSSMSASSNSDIRAPVKTNTVTACSGGIKLGCGHTGAL